MRSIKHVVGVAVVLLLGSGLWAGAQVAVASADIQRLQDQVYEASNDIARLRGRDDRLASQLQTELDMLREEVIYLKVKLRKERAVTRTEYADLRDRIDALRSRARGEPQLQPVNGEEGAWRSGATGTTAATSPDTVPVGTELDARLQSSLSSKTARVEDRFDATTVVDLSQGGRVLVPAGSIVRGIVTSVDRATRTDRKGSLTVSFDQITINRRSYPIRGTVTQALESEGIRGEAGRIGTGAGVGAIIGGILGGFRGALAGILIGGGGVIAATPGQDVELPPGTILRMRLDTPLTVK